MSAGLVHLRRAIVHAKAWARPLTGGFAAAAASTRPKTPLTIRRLNAASNGNGKDTMSGGTHNAWVGAEGPGAWDLRSDTMTTPTAAMLAAIQTCTLRDDVFGEDASTSGLEAHMAALAGKEAGLFVLSGTMGNQLALRAHLKQPPHSVLCDHRSHIVQYEAGGVSSLSQAMTKTVIPSNGVHLTLEDVRAHAVLDDGDLHACPTRVISLENTLNGMIMPLAEARRITAFAREHGIATHLDGARLWEAVVSDGRHGGETGTLPEYCALFDTVSLCFSKGLGAPVGSVLVGDAKTLKHARWTRKAVGGGMRQPGMLAAAARVAVDVTFGTKPDGADGLLRPAHDLARRVEQAWRSRGGAFVHPVHTNMCWLDLAAARCSSARFVALCGERGITALGGRLVINYQVAQNGDEILRRLEEVFDKVFGEPEEVGGEAGGQKNMYKGE